MNSENPSHGTMEWLDIGQVNDHDEILEVRFECVRQRNAPSAGEARVMKWGNERKTHV